MPYIVIVVIALIFLYWQNIVAFSFDMLVYIVLPISGIWILTYMFKKISSGSGPPEIKPNPLDPEPRPPPRKHPVVDLNLWLRTTWSDESRTRIVRLEVNFMGLPKKRRDQWHDLKRLSPKEVMYILVNHRGDRVPFAKAIEQALEDLDAGWTMSWDEGWINTPNVRFEMTVNRKALNDALVLTGAYRNRTCNDLTDDEYAQLCAGLRRIAPFTVSLLEVVRANPATKEEPSGRTTGQSRPRPTDDPSEVPPFTGLTKMTLRDAREILGIRTDADEVKQRQRVLQQQLHQEKGGTHRLAQLVNDAAKRLSNAINAGHPGGEHNLPLQSPGEMSLREAAEILGLTQETTIREIKEQAQTLLGRTHPNEGGSARLEQLVIQASALMRKHNERKA